MIEYVILAYSPDQGRKTTRKICSSGTCGLEVEWIGKQNEGDWIGVEERKGDW